MKMARHVQIAAVVLVTAAVAAACGSSSAATVTQTVSGPGGQPAGGATALSGAGSTLVAPLVAQWEAAYVKTPAAVTVAYGAIGSGAGIDAITARTVDFGASDAPLTADQAQACKGCLQIPWALAATAVAYHANGVPNGLHLTGGVVADIYLGKITSWNDPAIARLNPGVKLPGTHITVVYRSDGSGDSFVFSSYLSAVSAKWKTTYGASTQPAFPTGSGAKGNSGVAAAIQATDGAIGYVAAAYIGADKLDAAPLQNAAGRYVGASAAGIAAAARAMTSFAADGSISLVNPPASAAAAYPMATYTYVLVPERSPKAEALKAFLKYAIGPTGQAFGPPLVFVPLPPAVVSHDTAQIDRIQQG